MRLLDGKISKEDEVSIEELHQYLIEDDGSWALGDNFLVFVGKFDIVFFVDYIFFNRSKPSTIEKP